MAYVDWRIEGVKISACSCDYGCPCEFNGRPTSVPCEGMEAMEIEHGRFGSIDLSGVRFGAFFRWPGPVHEGGGTVQGVIDRRATDEQRVALTKILSGEEQEPTTVFNIYGSTIETELDTAFVSIEFEYDWDARTGRTTIDGLGELSIEPIRNPVTGSPHRAQILLPDGFEFRSAEMASSTFRSTGPIALDRAGCYGFLARVAYGPYGLIDR